MFLKTREGAEVQPEAEDISEELPSTPAIRKPSLPLGRAMLCLHRSPRGLLCRCVITLGESLKKLLGTSWDFYLPIG